MQEVGGSIPPGSTKFFEGLADILGEEITYKLGVPGRHLVLNSLAVLGAAKLAGADLALVGVINLPIIKFSVDWWNTLHQPASVSRIGTPAIHSSMLWPLLIMAVAFTLFFIVVLIQRMRSELVAARLRALGRLSVEGR